MQYKKYKIIYIILLIIGVFIVYVMCGGSIYYPTSYRAFIPKGLDSEYKEYERLCKENIGRVVYARPITREEREILMQRIRVKLTEFKREEMGRKIPITADDVTNIKKEKNIDKITPELWEEMLIELGKRREIMIQKELAKKEVIEKIENSIVFEIPSIMTINPINKSATEIRLTFSLSDLDNIDKFKENIFYQVIVGYFYDRHFTEVEIFTKGSAVNKRFLHTRMRSDTLFSQSLENRQSIGTKYDIIIGDIY